MNIQIDKLNDELAQKDRELLMERLKNEQFDKLSQDSMESIHNNMLTILLDAQCEHDEKEMKLQQKVRDLQIELRKEILKNDVLQFRKDVTEVISIIVSDYLFGP